MRVLALVLVAVTGRLDGRLPRFLLDEKRGAGRSQEERHPVGEDPPVVVTSLGTIVGRRRADERPNGTAFEAEYFLGVPFGKPTAGERRWRPPVAADPWTGTRPAFFDPPECPQLGPENAVIRRASEDCLYLSVWRRAVNVRADGPGSRGKAGGAGDGTAKPALKPVLVWIHGGGFIAGNTHGNDATNLAVDHDLIVFNVQYRLGVFGFLALDSLANEQPDGTTGNYGIQDQRLGMRWVKENAAAFGGDPDSITLVGQSAGACSVVAHLTSQASAGLFHKAVAMSPIADNPMLTPSKAQATNFGLAFAHYVGCAQRDGADLLACLREETMAKLIGPIRLPRADLTSPDPAELLPLLLPFLPWGPVVDGAKRGTLGRPLDEIRAGRFNDVPVVMGSVQDEGTIFLPEMPFIAGVLYPLTAVGWPRVLRHFYNESLAGELFRLYPFDGATGNQIANRLVAEGWFDCSLRALVRAMAATPGHRANVSGGASGDVGGDTSATSSAPVASAAARAAPGPGPFRGVYRFSFGIRSPTSLVFKDFHACDVIYLFGHQKDWWRERDRALSLQIQCRVAALARTGAPNAHGPGGHPDCDAAINAVSWPAFTERGGSTLVYADPIAVDPTPSGAALCPAWDKIGYASQRQRV